MRLTHLLRNLPDSFALVSHPFAVTPAELSALKQTGLGLPEQLSNAVLKRQVEFLSGRYCARQALKLSGCTALSPLTISPYRYPAWPDGYLGSISHSSDMALAVTASSTHCSLIGVDVEHIMSPEAMASIMKFIASANDQALGAQHGMSPARWGTLIFSAKESVFKAIYPQIKSMFDFSICKISALDPVQQKIELTLTQTLSERFAKGWCATVHYEIIDDSVVTLYYA